MYTDYILNGKGFGSLGQVVAEEGFDPGYYRPYFDDNDVKCVTVNRLRPYYDDKQKKWITGGKEEVRISDLMANNSIFLSVWNATTLRKDDWIAYDRAVKKATRQRLSAMLDLRKNGVVKIDGMSKMILEHETVDDPGEAMVSMFGEQEGRNTPHTFGLQGIPLPITYSGWYFWQRQLQTSRNSRGTALDTLRAEAAGFKIGEMLERTLIGSVVGANYGVATNYGYGSQVFGYTTFTPRNVKTDLTTPTGANPNATVDDILEMRETMYQDGFFGPFTIYHSTDWDRWLDSDYAFVNSTGWAVNPNMTLRERIKAIDGIKDVKRFDYLPAGTNPYTLIMIQMTSNVARLIEGMPLNVLQWEEKGGQRQHYKAMTIQVPQLFADYNGNCGILQATTS